MQTSQPASSRRSTRAVAWAAAALAALLTVPVLAISNPVTSTASAAGSCSGATYTVVSGDSWSLVARKVGVAMTSLLAANSATTSTIIHPGQILCLPTATTTTAATFTTAPSTSVTLPAGVVVIRQFPVQGLCWFTDSWGAPRSGGRTHEGVDIIATRGKNIYAVDDGVLTKQYIDTPGALAGNGWRLTRADGTYFFYAHLESFAPGLKVGSVVKAGQIIGVVGQTGAAGTPHLHFEVHPGGGAPVNPTAIVRVVDGCSTLTVPPQPGVTPPTTTPSTTTPSTTAPPTTGPTTTAPTTTTVPAPSPALGNGLWQFISPITALDTQAPSGQRLAAGSTRTVTVAGLAADVTGAMVRVTVRNAERNGNLVVHRCGAVPTAATLNFAIDRLNATMSMVGVSGRTFCVTSSATLDVRLDLVAVINPFGVGLEPIPAKRAIDTRTTTPLVPGDPLVLAPQTLGAGRGSRAVTASITVLAPSGAGSLAIGPCGGTPWVVPYSASGHQLFGGVFRINDLGLCLSSTTEVQVVVDVTGVWRSSQLIGVAGPQRLLDSRTSGAITPTTRQISLDLPAGATRAQLTVAVVPGTSNGALVVWNCAVAKPTGSVVSTGGSVMSATLSLDVTGGKMCVASTGNVHAIVDLTAVG